MRAEVLSRIHEGTFGIFDKSKARPKRYVNWPRLKTEIESIMKQCETCQVHRNCQQKETLIPQVDSVRSIWEQIAMDIFHLKGNDDLFIVDYFSSFPIVGRLTDRTASSAIAQCKSVFAERGIPREFRADNLPFICAEFHEFVDKWEFTLKTASPHHPQGIWERTVQIVKQLL